MAHEKDTFQVSKSMALSHLGSIKMHIDFILPSAQDHYVVDKCFSLIRDLEKELQKIEFYQKDKI